MPLVNKGLTFSHTEAQNPTVVTRLLLLINYLMKGYLFYTNKEEGHLRAHHS